MKIYNFDEVSQHDDPNNGGYWVIIDSYVLDLSLFLQHHPSGARKILQRRKKSVDISSNFLDHFPHTVRAFRKACRDYDKTQKIVTLKFDEVPNFEVSIIGKVKSSR